MMNEQIEKLLIEASDKEKVNPITPDGEWVILTPKELQSFSELIVRECLSVVDRFKFKMDAGADNVTVAIKEHFGVK